MEELFSVAQEEIINYVDAKLCFQSKYMYMYFKYILVIIVISKRFNKTLPISPSSLSCTWRGYITSSISL